MPYSNLGMSIRKDFLEEGISKQRSQARNEELRVGISSISKGNSRSQEGMWNNGDS